ncbi:MAG: hypothetical protein IPI66_13725 [Chitinophagaceae bacterium]|nr:hypothetical protein [Chitinophagaceae bacterium]
MVKYLLPLILLVVFSTGNLLGQSPGGISANNKLWLRSDNGITTSGTTVTQWQENSGAAVTGNFTVLPLAGTANVQTGPTLIPAGVNFNPYLSFDGITNSLSSVNNFLGTALVSNSNVTVFQVLNLKSGIVWLKWVDLARVIIYCRSTARWNAIRVESTGGKPGVTLNQLAANANNYVASDATVTWDRALNSACAQRCHRYPAWDYLPSALSQKRSRIISHGFAGHALQYDTYPGGIFPALNSANTNSFFNNLSFLLIGDNGGTTTIDQCALDGRAGRMHCTCYWKRPARQSTQTRRLIAVNREPVFRPP